MKRPGYFDVDPPALLRQAAAVMQAMQPAASAQFYAGGTSYRARFDWPGRVRVFDRNTGELIVQSLPGQPTTPDTGAGFHALERGGAR